MIPSNSRRPRALNPDMRRFVPPAIALALLAAPAAHAGPLDRTYGNGGVASSTTLLSGDAAWLDRGGRVLVAGGDPSDPGVLRLTSTGRHDTRFGQRGGVAIAPRFDGFFQPFAVRRVRTRRIVVAGFTQGLAESTPVTFLRFGRSGAPLANRFHRGGFDAPDAVAVAGVQRRDGGAYVLSTNGRLRAIRSSGLTDRRFAGGTVTAAPTIEPFRSPPALALDGLGRVLVALRDDRGPAILRFRRDGTRDRRFGGDGRVRVPFHAEALRVLRGGDVVGAADAPRHLARAFRLSSRGTQRRRFGTRGVARGRRGEASSVEDVVADRRGRLYVLAHTPDNAAVVAFNRDGSRRGRFGPRGARLLPAPGPDFERNVGNRLLLDGRRGLLVIGSQDTLACDGREDIDCVFFPEQLAVWRFRL